MAEGTDDWTADMAVVVMNPRSGGGKVDRFRLTDRVRATGAKVILTSPDQDAASLAKEAIADGATVLGVAGGDGTVSAVAAVAAKAGRPLLVIPAGTRNHFARDLGLKTTNPASAVTALRAGALTRVDLGQVGTRTFINNVSLGAYADALLTPGYRDAKARTFARIAPDYVAGEQWINASVGTPQGEVEFPQVVLVSNNPYHISTLPHLGRRFALDTGRLGGIVLKQPAGARPPELLPRLGRELRHGHTGPPGEGLITWTDVRITLHSTVAQLPAGIDGEAVTLDLPIVCQIRPGALRVLLPRTEARDPAKLFALAAQSGRRPTRLPTRPSGA
jgi:diacylglycerol kinase family enzyme